MFEQHFILDAFWYIFSFQNVKKLSHGVVLLHILLFFVELRSCDTKCDKPQCKVECAMDMQCESVCEKPSCWRKSEQNRSEFVSTTEFPSISMVFYKKILMIHLYCIMIYLMIPFVIRYLGLRTPGRVPRTQVRSCLREDQGLFDKILNIFFSDVNMIKLHVFVDLQVQTFFLLHRILTRRILVRFSII